jgi:hypothetical protein
MVVPAFRLILLNSAGLELVACFPRVLIEHPDRLERILAQILSDQNKLSQDVGGSRDDVAADRIGLEDI